MRIRHWEKKNLDLRLWHRLMTIRARKSPLSICIFVSIPRCPLKTRIIFFLDFFLDGALSSCVRSQTAPCLLRAGFRDVCVCVCELVSRVRLFVTPWTVAHQTPLSIEFSRQEYWSGLPFPFPGDLPNPGMEPPSPALQADTLPFETHGKPRF